MIAHVGDHIVLEGTDLGEPSRAGVITAVAHADGGPPYQVRWDDDRITLIFPGAEARIEAPRPGACPNA